MRRISMFQLQELVRLHRMGTKCHEVARLLGISPNTERSYRLALVTAGFLKGATAELPTEEELQRGVTAVMGDGCPAEQESTVQLWLGTIHAWSEDNAQPTAIYERLKREQPEFSGSLSAVKRACLRFKRQRGVQPEDVAIPVETLPGHTAQVDFGYVGKLFDPVKKTLRKAWVFVMILGYSRHVYCEIVFDQKIDTWLSLHINAFEWFGGVPEVVVPDNLKSAVIRAAFSPDDTVALNRCYRELARHYCFKIDPAPPYSPEKKGKVESSVKYVKRSFFLVYGTEFDADELQRRLALWCTETAGLRIHGTTRKQPLVVFKDIEQAKLRALPAVRFEPVIWKSVTVHRDTHVHFEQALYSVPWRWGGKKAWVRATLKSVQIYVDSTRVATHQRGRSGDRVTVEEHLPEGRRELRHRSRSYWLDRADRIGSETGKYVREVFDSDDVLEQLRKVQHIVTYVEGFPPYRVEAACKRASFFANYEYRALKRILTHGLETQPLPIPSAPRANNMNEPPRYARDITQMLEQQMEETYEPN